MTEVITQGEAIKRAVKSVMGEGQGAYKPSKEQLELIHAEVFRLYKLGMWRINKAWASDDSKVKKYIPGVTNNWLRKGKELNGGVKYQAKNPGSRQGSGDETLRAMKDLREALVQLKQDTTEVDKAIEARKAELAPKPKEIKVDALPEHLKALAKQLLPKPPEDAASDEQQQLSEDEELERMLAEEAAATA